MYGEHPLIRITIDDEDFGITFNVPVHITGPGYDKTIYLNAVSQEIGNEVIIEDDLKPGTYNVEVTFTPVTSNYYYPETATTTFEAKKHDPIKEIRFDDIELGQQPIMHVSCSEDLEKDVTVSSPQFAKDHKIHIEHADKSYTLDETLKAGDYNCIVSYPGDGTHLAKDYNMHFTVNKHDPNFKVEADDIVKGNDIHVKVHANKSVNGEAKLDLVTDSISSLSSSKLNMVPAKIVNGEGNATIPNNLPPGKYILYASYDGDDNFKKSTAYDRFTVKAEPDLSVKVENTSARQKPKVEVFANENFTGKVNVVILDSYYSYDIDVVNGYGSAEVHVENRGSHKVFATFKGNDKFGPGEASTSFNVSGLQPNIALQAQNITVGETERIVVTGDKTLSNYIEIDCYQDPNEYSKTHTVILKNGTDVVNIDGLAPGNYTVRAYFSGNYEFEKEIVYTNFTVKEKD